MEELLKLLKQQGDANKRSGGFPRDLTVSEHPWKERNINAAGFVDRRDPLKVYLDGNRTGPEREHARQHEFEHTQQNLRAEKDEDYFSMPDKHKFKFLLETKEILNRYAPKEVRETNMYLNRLHPNTREALADWSALFKNLPNEQKLAMLQEPMFKNNPYIRQWLFSRMDPMHDKVMPSDYDFKDPSPSLGRTIDYIRSKIRQATQY